MLVTTGIRYLLLNIVTLSSVVLPVLSLGSSCAGPLGSGNAGPTDPYWLQSMPKRGTSAFNANPSTYPVRRNVKDYGAIGDGQTDDTTAINAAIADGNRCGGGTCGSSTLTPALVYFPPGTYLVSKPIISWYYTQLIGDPNHPPTLLASANFTGIAVIDADVYIPGGNGGEWYVNQDNFFREVRNFVIDLTRMPASASATGLHWQVSQATSLYNIRVEMSKAAGTAHQGIFMENGSGGFMGDLVFNGGKYGMWVGNQQFTVRNVTVNNAQSAIFQIWNWGWTFQGVTINNCQIGFEITTGGITPSTQTAGAETIIDATVSNTPVFLQTTQTSNGSLAGSLLLDNIALSNVDTAVRTAQGIIVVAGPGAGTSKITQWAQGNVYSGTSPTGQFVQSELTPPTKPASLLSGGKIMSRTRPQYEHYSTGQIVSVKAEGAKGDGTTDDTASIQAVIDKFWGCRIIFFDAGTYVVTDTINIPAGTIITGEVWPVIMGSGSNFASQSSPRPVVQVGAPGSTGTMEITDLIFATRGPAPGAIVVEWNVLASGPAKAGAWDTHIRLGSAQGTNLGAAQCPTNGNHVNSCFSAFMGLHLTSQSSAYLEGMWVWNGDHDLDGNQQVSLFSGRGIYSESCGPTWLIGTAEHHVLYQYNLVNAVDHYLGLIQTESPYYQPNPAPPGPFSTNPSFNDPSFPAGQDHSWGLRVATSSNILVYGAGLYSFFQNYGQTCINTHDCQTQITDVDSTSSVSVYSLSTVGTTWQLSVNEKGIIDQSKNVDGFASTVTAWTRNSAIASVKLKSIDIGIGK